MISLNPFAFKHYTSVYTFTYIWTCKYLFLDAYMRLCKCVFTGDNTPHDCDSEKNICISMSICMIYNVYTCGHVYTCIYLRIFAYT
jgi:hypothetical protein